MLYIVLQRFRLSSLIPYICTPLDLAEHQLWWYCIPWEFHCSYVSLLQINILFRLPLRPPLCIIISICIDQLPFFEPWSHYLFFWHCYEHGYAYIICLPHPYTCHKPIIKKIYRISNEQSTLIHGSLQSLYYCHHYSYDPMISIIHMMRSYPHTSGGN